MNETQILKGLMLGDQRKLQTLDPDQGAAAAARTMSSIRSKSEVKGSAPWAI